VSFVVRLIPLSKTQLFIAVMFFWSDFELMDHV
jgi:hypothetical protein